MPHTITQADFDAIDLLRSAAIDAALDSGPRTDRHDIARLLTATDAVAVILDRLRAEAAKRDEDMDREEKMANDIDTVRAVHFDASCYETSRIRKNQWQVTTATGSLSNVHPDRYAAWADAADRVRKSQTVEAGL